MVFFAFLLVNATLFLRPTELFPEFGNLPIYAVLMTICCVGALREIQGQLQFHSLLRQPITLCVVGLFFAIVLSHLSHFSFYGVRETAIPFLKIILYYLTFVALVNTPQRLKQVLLAIAISASLMVTLCVVDYLGFVDFEFVEHLGDWDDAPTEDSEGTRVLRMRGTGLFQDPNDISLVIAATEMLCAFLLTDRTAGVLRWVWLLPMSSLGMGLLFTQSRGGLLMLVGAGLTYAAVRFGRKVAIAAAILGMCALPVLGGRQSKLDLSGGTGQDRLQLWGEGLAELKSPNIVFGIGMGEFSEIAGLVAHNSYVHAYVELGFFGGTLFFGCVFFSLLALARMHREFKRGDQSGVDPELLRFHPYAAGVLAGWAVGLFSLSRCYVVPTYLVFALMAAYLNLVRRELVPWRLLTVWDRASATRLCAGSGAFLIGLFVFVRLFVQWG